MRRIAPAALVACLAVPALAAADDPPGDPGNGVTPPGLGGTPPGLGGTPPGLGPDNPGNGGNPPGLDGDNPGNGGNPPGHGGTPPGHGGTPPGHEPDKPGNGPQRESSSTTVIVERVTAPAAQHTEASSGLTAAPVVKKKRCVSRRVIRIRLDRHYRVRSARVVAGGRIAKVRRTRRGLFATVDLRGRRQGVYTVRAVLLTKSGKLRVMTRRFATCAARAKKRG
ncbi:MAG TPA: hypothetical protein VGW75_00420 [Solirubrobacteraceae bacterium]|nr:hypothetical protein [Solirubrobacteraceae bacterium]